MLLVVAFTGPSLLGKFNYFNGKYIIIPAIIVIIYAVIKDSSRKIDKFEICIIIQIIYFLLLIQYYRFNEVFTIFSLCLNLLIYRLIKGNEKITNEIAYNYVVFMCIISLLSLLGLAGFYLNFFNQYIINELNVEKTIYLIGPSFTSELIERDGIVRASGIYGEPGQFALHLTFALFFCQFIEIRKIFKIIIVAGLISTMSMGGYIALFVLYIFRINYKKLLILLLMVLMIFVLYNYTIYPTAKIVPIDYVLTRLSEFNGLGNRSLSYEIGIENIGEIGLFGTSDELYSELLMSDVDATLLGYFYRYGWIGGFIAFLHIFVFLGYQIKMVTIKNIYYRSFYIAIIVIIMSILIHRPFVLIFSIYLLLLLLNRLEIFFLRKS